MDTLHTPLLVLISGLPGSGKSFFAKELSKRIGALWLSSDKVRKELFSVVKYTKSQKEKVYRALFEMAQHSLEDGQSVVIDATFYLEKLRQPFFLLANLTQAKMHVIEIVSEQGLIQQRISEKRENSDADFRVYQMVKKQFEPVAEDHLVIQSKKDNLPNMIETALSVLK